MKSLSSFARLDIFGLSLTVALAAACSFDISQLGPPSRDLLTGPSNIRRCPTFGASEKRRHHYQPARRVHRHRWKAAVPLRARQMRPPPQAGAVAAPPARPDAPTATGGTSRTGGTGAGGTDGFVKPMGVGALPPRLVAPQPPAARPPAAWDRRRGTGGTAGGSTGGTGAAAEV